MKKHWKWRWWHRVAWNKSLLCNHQIYILTDFNCTCINTNIQHDLWSKAFNWRPKWTFLIQLKPQKAFIFISKYDEFLFTQCYPYSYPNWLSISSRCAPSIVWFNIYLDEKIRHGLTCRTWTCTATIVFMWAALENFNVENWKYHHCICNN